MAAANYRKAKPEIRLAFMIGYLCGGLTDTGMMRQGEAAHTRWAQARESEIERLCRKFDAAMLASFKAHISNLKARNN